jgi:SNW domain-containing protein 1
MQQRLVEKEKASKEEHLRMLAQRAREERGGMVAAPKATAEGGVALKSSLAAYGSESGSESGSEGSGDDAEDEEAKKLRDNMRVEKRREREREMRMNNMGTEQRAKMLARFVPVTFAASNIILPALTCHVIRMQQTRES